MTAVKAVMSLLIQNKDHAEAVAGGRFMDGQANDSLRPLGHSRIFPRERGGATNKVD